MPSETSSSPSVVVGIGASAGGVEAISRFLDHESGRSSAAFVVLMHMAVARTSHLAEILSRHTAMPVEVVTDGTALEPGHVYVLPPAMMLAIRDAHLWLAPLNPDDRMPTVIDRFFNSLAEAYGERAIGVVLSGTGADGALGLKAIKDRGGLTIAQGEGRSVAQSPGMPESAMATGAVDAQLPVEDIGGRLALAIAAFHQEDHAPQVADEQAAQEAEALRQEICALLRERVGHDFSGYKTRTFFRRVQRRMYALGLAELSAYVDTLKASPMEATLLFHDLLISVTSFFRDAAAFEALCEIIPALFAGKGPADEVRVWVPGCATGEEPYSVGILLLEHAATLGVDAPRLRVFATDIDERALDIGRAGRYPSVLLDGVSAARREAFFTEDRRQFTVQKRLRAICTFASHNVLRDAPFSRMDLVSCRNLLIYLDGEVQDRLIPILHYALRADGYLFMGMAEGAMRHDKLFAPVSKIHHIFRKLPGPTPNVARPLLARSDNRPESRALLAAELGSTGHVLRRRIDTQVLQRYAPAYVLVNADGEALSYSPRTGTYLEFSAGSPSRQVLANARKELRLGLRRGLHEAVERNGPVLLPEVDVAVGDATRRVQIRVEPFEDEGTQLYLVLFHDLGPALELPDASAAGSTQTVPQLQVELRETRQQLQSTYQEFDTTLEELRLANAELVSANEEMQSSNEEMETSREELQSVNEELQTVNHEMARHMEALDQSNADLRGLLENTGIAAIFLDRNLRIRRFTSAATEIFTLLPSDCGRHISDLHHELQDGDLRAELEQALDANKPLQRNVQRTDGNRHYLMRMLPYTGHADAGGMVLTLVDVTELARANARHKTMIGELNHRVRNMLAVVSGMAQQTLAPVVGPELLDAFLSRLFAMARTYKLLTEADWGWMALHELIGGELGCLVGVDRFALTGPTVQLDPRETLALGMVMHELATNAAKYGALSNTSGRVEVTWSQADDGNGTLAIHWRESGGPAVAAPRRRGFGSLLLERQLAYELQGRSDVDFAVDGLAVDLYIPRTEHVARDLA